MQRMSSCVLALVCALIATGCPDKYKVEPSKPELVKRNKYDTLGPGQWVTGFYTLRRDSNGFAPATFNGESMVTGGGCLIYQVPNKNEGCSTAEDCRPPTLDAGTVAERKAASYCLKNIFKPPASQLEKANVDNPLPEKTCWYKHSEAWCRKEPFTELEVGQKMQLPNVPARPLGEAVFWRVVTCQNLTLAPGKPGCAGGVRGTDFELQEGEIASF